MYAHIPPEVVLRRPWIGTLLSLVFVGIVGTQLARTYRQYRSFPPQAAMISLQGKNALPAGEAWVVLTGGRLECGHAVERPRSIPDRWLFGRVDYTQVPLCDASGRTRVVVRFDGAIDCGARAGRSISGLLTQLSRKSRAQLVRRGMPLPAEPAAGVMHLREGYGPEAARRELQLGSGLLAFGVVMTFVFWIMQLRRWMVSPSRSRP